MSTENRVVENLNFKEYLLMDGVSQSSLKLLDKCPRNYQYAIDNKEETDAMRFGSAMHCYVLEPAKFNKEYFVTPKITRRGAKWDAVLREAGERESLFEHDYEKIKEISKSLLRNPYFANNCCNANSKKELSMFWVDRDTGISCKGRPDVVSNMAGVVLHDLKSTVSCIKSEFERQVATLKYHMQAAYYLDGYKEATGIMPDGFVFYAVEKLPPFLNTSYMIKSDSEACLIGRDEYKNYLNKYSECVKNNNFDVGLEDEINIIDKLPAWYKHKNNNEE